MTGSSVERGKQSTRRLLIQRIRVVLLICLIFGPVFTILNVYAAPSWSPLQFYVNFVGLTLVAIALIALRGRWAVRYAWLLSIGVVALAYVITALSGIVGPSGEFATTAVLFAGAALTTATIVPWGMWPQCATVAVALAALGVAIWRADGSLHAAATTPVVATLVGFMLSVIMAREVNRYRLAHRRELQARRRSEIAVRRFNMQLEQRVRERTADLEASNCRLTEEIDERRKATDALSERQAQLNGIVDNSPAIISLKDLEGRYCLVNREFERCFQRWRYDVIGKSDGELFVPGVAHTLAARDRQVMESGTAESFEQEFIVDGEQRSYVCIKFPLRGPRGATYGIGGVFTDISLLKRLQEELRCHQDELAHVLRLHTIGEMSATLAHEINQPLCAITNYAQGGVQRIRSGAGAPFALLHAFRQIAAQALRAAEIVRGIRNLARTGSVPRALIDVNALAAEAARILEPRARLRRVTVRLAAAPSLPLVEADATQVEQVILNLLLNGVEAVDDLGSTRREVVVTTATNGDAVEVAVHDSGGGIPPLVAEQMFTPFFTTKSHALGLGLAISRSIIESHGGRLWYQPLCGSGTTFCFSLPLAAIDDSPQGSRVVAMAG